MTDQTDKQYCDGLGLCLKRSQQAAPKVVEAIAKFDDLPSETLLSVHTTEHPVIEAYRLLTVGDLRALAAIRKEPEGTSTQGDGA